VRNDMARIRDFAGEAPLSEWVRLLKEQTDELVLLAKVHDSARSAVTREAVESVLDSMEGLLRGTHRTLEQETHHEAHWVRPGVDPGPESRPPNRCAAHGGVRSDLP
jgi:hypothetical protein